MNSCSQISGAHRFRSGFENMTWGNQLLEGIFGAKLAIHGSTSFSDKKTSGPGAGAEISQGPIILKSRNLEKV